MVLFFQLWECLVKFDVDYWLWKDCKSEWEAFCQNNLNGVWYFRYAAAALALFVAYLFWDATSIEKYDHGLNFAMLALFSLVFVIYAIAMMKEITKIVFWCAIAFGCFRLLSSYIRCRYDRYLYIDWGLLDFECY
ncbi:hypothetical protein B9Z35_01065 [Limnohabitans sp. Jir61]|uniref:hypothetical protein n=1 Tax=Limnohabitans sp. Jir61 TaxID=1826168 RepID=UPI000D3C2B71|nr:hypothetical protein [Limnohabitans sp. Jir61]PUE32176.1 hypothetical protein B9Z35_01065 [Limnohabitans sp. Jir61]